MQIKHHSLLCVGCLILKKQGAVPDWRVNVKLNFFSSKESEQGIQMSVCLFIKPALVLLSFPLVSEPEASPCLSPTVPMWQPELSKFCMVALIYSVSLLSAEQRL